jgi:hypothetical protein
MKRAAVVAFVLFASAASIGAETRTGTEAVRVEATSSEGGVWSCDPSSNMQSFAQTDATEMRGCVTLHGDRGAKARVFASSTVFANVCPIVVRKDFVYDAGCSGARLPKIVKGDTIDLRYRDGSYWLSIDGANGSILASIKLMPEFIALGADAKKVEGYAWLKGSDGRVVYYVYIDGAEVAVAGNHSKKFIVEMYDAADTNCAHHAPDVSAIEDKECSFVSGATVLYMQGGTGPGGEPPPTKK